LILVNLIHLELDQTGKLTGNVKMPLGWKK
jgi:hypothetical protein